MILCAYKGETQQVYFYYIYIHLYKNVYICISGVSTGPMKVTFLGNDEFRVYVETGQAVSDVSVAESFCKSGYVVLSPYAWNLATQSMYETEILHDDSHVRVSTF